MLYVIIELLVERRLKVVVRLSICPGKMSDLIKPCEHLNRKRFVWPSEVLFISSVWFVVFSL